MADEWTAKDPAKPRFVAGVLGPTNRTASISPDVNDPGKRNVTYDELVAAYTESTHALIEGGADIILIETIFDTLNAKAAAFAVDLVFEELGYSLPVMISGTITDASGRTLSGQTTEAFYHSPSPRQTGLLRPQLRWGRTSCANTWRSCPASARPMSAPTPTPVCPMRLASTIWTRSRWRSISASGLRAAFSTWWAAAAAPPRPTSVPWRTPWRASHPAPCRICRWPVGCRAWSLIITADSMFVNVGERTNVTGSAKFKRLIKEGLYDEALDVAKQQVENGAQIIDINMDEGMLDAEAAMVRFLNLIAGEPDIARVPVMIDSSKWEVLEAGLKCVQGKPVVNSISMKEGRTNSSSRRNCCAATAPPSSSWRSTRWARPIPGPQVRDLPARLPHSGGPRRLPAGRHHLRPQHLRGGDRHRRAQQLRGGLHRGGEGHQNAPAPTP